MSAVRPTAVIVLAAGEGTRMKSRTPKVLHELAGRSLVGHAVAAASALDPLRLLVVVGHGREAVTAHLRQVAPTARPVVQEEQNGTGHAVRIALQAAAREADDLQSGTVVVTAGDSPLLSGATLAALVHRHESERHAATVLTAVLADPTGYGRILRAPDGAVMGIVEEKDATAAQRAVCEVNSGMYAFDGQLLRAALSKITTANVQGEEYLTDVLAILRAEGHSIGAVAAADPAEILGVNDRVQLAQARRILRDRVAVQWMLDGVTIVDPATTWIDVTVRLEPDVVLRPNTSLQGATAVYRGADIGPNCVLQDTRVGESARVSDTTALSVEIGAEASVGPYTFLRPGTRLGRGARAGGFVEMKAAVLGEGSKVPHLSYVGDAEIGRGSNIGAATVFVNYDGVAKHRTVVGDAVRVGSDTMLIAPVTIGNGAYTAAGSVITTDVPPGALAIARGRQRNVEGWVERNRAGTAAAEAAEGARESAVSPANHEEHRDGAVPAADSKERS